MLLIPLLLCSSSSSIIKNQFKNGFDKQWTIKLLFLRLFSTLLLISKLCEWNWNSSYPARISLVLYPILTDLFDFNLLKNCYSHSLIVTGKIYILQLQEAEATEIKQLKTVPKGHNIITFPHLYVITQMTLKICNFKFHKKALLV